MALQQRLEIKSPKHFFFLNIYISIAPEIKDKSKITF